MAKDLLEVQKKHYEILLQEQDQASLKRIHEDFLTSYTYDAVSLEGNSKIPFSEIKRLVRLNEVIDKNSKSEKEVINHIRAFNKVLELVKRNKDLTEEQLKDIHAILLEDIMIGGVYRNVNVQIIGGAHQPPDYLKVYDKMKNLFLDLSNSDLDDFSKGIFLHVNLAKTYPFLDGNGRMARLVLNSYLIKAGYIPISIPLDDREEYFKNLEIFKVDKNIEPIKNYIISLLNNRYETLIKQLDI